MYMYMYMLLDLHLYLYLYLSQQLRQYTDMYMHMSMHMARRGCAPEQPVSLRMIPKKASARGLPLVLGCSAGFPRLPARVACIVASCSQASCWSHQKSRCESKDADASERCRRCYSSLPAFRETCGGDPRRGRVAQGCPGLPSWVARLGCPAGLPRLLGTSATQKNGQPGEK